MNPTMSQNARRSVLATDLDGTFIPLDGEPQNRTDLDTLADELVQNHVTLVFVTGRHLESVMEAIDTFQLPTPEWIICDVGTSIYRRQSSGQFKPVEAYQQHLDRIIAGMPLAELQKRLESFDGLRLQEQEKQGRFKLSYYVDADRLDDCAAQIRELLSQTDAPYSIIDSVDPFTNDGLIDLLPSEVSKSHALDWWVNDEGLECDHVVFSGDSGNDLAALTADYRAILVGNADRKLARQVYDIHRRSGRAGRLYLSQGKATSGVLEGCRWFGLLSQDASPITASLDTAEIMGATPVSHDETCFRVWAPKRSRVAVEVLHDDSTVRHELAAEDGGCFSAIVQGAGPNAVYRYVLDDRHLFPDPRSRFQPKGVHGPSQVIHAGQFPWTDQQWAGVQKSDLIIYELHIGAFTEEGTFRAAIERLPELLELGVTAIEIMPVAQSPGRWNWGYDGVDLFAVRNTFGCPDDFKALVDACHATGLAVILDVVYNHLGPEGNFWGQFGPYFSEKHHTPWGEAFNYDEANCEPVRQFVVDNAVFWLDEYHIDGLRLDAIHFIMDKSPVHVMNDIRRATSEYARDVGRTVHLIAESNIYDYHLLEKNAERDAYDAIWCDCLMHSIYAHGQPKLQLTHRVYHGGSELAEALQHGYLYAGNAYVDTTESRVSQEKRISEPFCNAGPDHIESLVIALQTHDGVGNHPHGLRIHQIMSEAFQRSAASLILLYPGIPLMFMGEPCATDARFPFFADFEDEHLRDVVDQGRQQEYSQHDWQGALHPSDPEAYYCAKCSGSDTRRSDMASWYRELICLRKEGVQAGWLSAERMTSGYEPWQNIFSLRFSTQDGGSVVVLSRLTPAGQSDVDPVQVPLPGTLLLSSEPGPKLIGQNIMLEANHAVVYTDTV